MTRFEALGRGRGRAVTLLIALGTLTGCDLDVTLPHLLTDDALRGPTTAEFQVLSAVALFECGYTAFGLKQLGAEDTMESIAGVFVAHNYGHTVNAGECDSGSFATTSVAYFDQIVGSRALLTTQPSRLVPTAEGTVTPGFPVGRGVYDRMQDEWSLGPQEERLSAIAAIYVAAALGHLGEYVCEIAIDGSELHTPTQILDLAEDWISGNGGSIPGALTHITNFGDFVMPNGIAGTDPGARNMALALRARIRWAKRDYAGAAADAATVLAAAPTFTAWITRETGPTRRNKIYYTATAVGYSGMLGINTWWNPAIRRPNPATGQPWPNPIPFTGYLFLGIMPDGRTLETSPLNTPVRWAEEVRDASGNPIPLANGAVADTRVTHRFQSIQGPDPREVPTRYTREDEDIPLVSWEELKLIQADRELELGNLTNAIALVNELRTAKSLPTIASSAPNNAYYLTLTDGNNDAAEVRYMLLEERRRELFAEGARYHSTKIQNTDLLWFPRFEGALPSGYSLQGVVRTLFASSEYEGNANWLAAGGLALRGTGCSSLPGSQEPAF